MEKISNHPANELLAAYSAGSLPLSQALCIAAHLEHCRGCMHELQQLDRVGSELMQQLEPAPAAGDDRLKQDLLARLDSLEAKKVEPAAEADSSIPRCLRKFVTDGYQNLRWKRVSRGIQTVELCRDSNGARVELLKIRPGSSAVTHSHSGDEYTVILEGSFSDEHGLYRKGDFVVKTEHDSHTPVATLDRECICLAVSEGPIQLTGFFGRLLNPFIRRSYA
jgi:putative transcriptional regulator